MRPELFQLMAAAAPHDAVTAQAIALQSALARAGIRSKIAAQHVDPTMKDEVLPLRAVPADTTPLLLRYSIWSAAAEAALVHPGRVGIVYHNITPAPLLRRANPVVAAQCARGRRELPRFAPVARTVIADSHFNAGELMDVGFKEVDVVPLILEVSRVAAEPPIAPPRLLFVGRLTPSKRVEDVIDVLALVRRRHGVEAELRLVGSARSFEPYEDALRHHAMANGVADAVHFMGAVSDRDRDHLYATSGVYVSMSEHEGFCVPLVEAMRHGLPVVARDAGAVRETAGGGALLVQGGDVRIAAAAVALVLEDDKTRAALARNAAVRLDQLRPEVVTPAMVSAVKALVQ